MPAQFATSKWQSPGQLHWVRWDSQKGLLYSAHAVLDGAEGFRHDEKTRSLISLSWASHVRTHMHTLALKWSAYRNQHWIHLWKPLLIPSPLGLDFCLIKLFLLENHHCLLAKGPCKLEGEHLDTSRHIPSLKQGPVNIRWMHEWVVEWMNEARKQTSNGITTVHPQP